MGTEKEKKMPLEIWVVIQEIVSEMDLRVLYVGDSKDEADYIAQQNEFTEEEVYCYVRKYESLEY
jgi:hypothetical protein